MDYNALSIEELERLALTGDEVAAEVYAEKISPVLENGSMGINANDTKVAEDDAGITAESENIDNIDDDLVVESVDAGEKRGYLESLLKSSLLTIKEKMDDGDLIAKFAYGIVQNSSDSSTEALNGLRLMSESMKEMQRMLQTGRLSAQEYISFLSKYAEHCRQGYYKYYTSTENEVYGREYFNIAVMINELDPSDTDLLINCYSEGIGCAKDKDKVIELKEKKARNSGCINCADLAVEFIKNGVNIKAIEWAQKALAAEDSNAYPLIASRFKIWLSEHNQTDEKGNIIDPVKEEQLFSDTDHIPGSQEAYILFALSENEEEKARFAKYCMDYDEAKQFIEEKEEAERAAREEEERRLQEEHERIERELKLKAEREEAERVRRQKQEEEERKRKAAEEEAQRKHSEELNRIKNITDDPSAYLEGLKGQPLFKLVEANKEDPYAQYVYGKIQYELASNDTEKYNGISIMLESAKTLQEAIDEKEHAKTVAGILTTCADRCIDYCAFLQNNNSREKIESFSKAAFDMYKHAYEIDNEKVDRLIWCYERGIGCEKNTEKALQLKISKAQRGGILENAEVVADYKQRGMTVESALWSQKALSCKDVDTTPKLSSKLRMIIAEGGFTDETGKTIDVEAERARYYEAGIPTSSAEAFILFKLADDEHEKLELAESCKSYKSVSDYIKEKENEREALERQAIEEAKRKLELEKEAERLEELKAKKQERARNISTLGIIAIIVVIAIALIALLGKIITSSPSALVKGLAAIAILVVVLFIVGRNKNIK